jgi:hypothetical protein
MLLKVLGLELASNGPLLLELDCVVEELEPAGLVNITGAPVAAGAVTPRMTVFGGVALVSPRMIGLDVELVEVAAPPDEVKELAAEADEPDEARPSRPGWAESSVDELTKFAVLDPVVLWLLVTSEPVEVPSVLDPLVLETPALSVSSVEAVSVAGALDVSGELSLPRLAPEPNEPAALSVAEVVELEPLPEALASAVELVTGTAEFR